MKATGQCAIEVAFDNRLDPPAAAHGRFYLAAYPATVNQLGLELALWVENIQGIFEYDWADE